MSLNIEDPLNPRWWSVSSTRLIENKAYHHQAMMKISTDKHMLCEKQEQS